MAEQMKEPCKKAACDIQSCLSKNNFDSRKCLKVIETLQACCERCNYSSTHCASLSGLLKQKPKELNNNHVLLPQGALTVLLHFLGLLWGHPESKPER